MEGQDVGGLVRCPDGKVFGKEQGEGFDAFGEFLIDRTMRDFVPHVLEVDLPLVVLELGADFFDFLVNKFSIEINGGSGELAVEFCIEFHFEFIFEHVEEVADLAFILY